MRLFEAEQQRTRELAKSLEDLQTTQGRLVQTQKLASLGQLTAGIAHEIKNPLNFVNNFSGVSAELIDELRETLDRVKTDEKTRTEIGGAANRRDCHPQRHRKGGADARDQERARDRGHGQHCQRQPDQEPDLGLRHVQFIMQLRNDRRRDQKRHAHGDASKPEETKQSSKTAGRATVAARRC